MPGKKVFFASARSQAHFIYSKKVPGKKCHLLPHLPRHLTFFSVVSSPGIFCVFKDKSAWGKKSAWQPGCQVAAYYAGLLLMIGKWALRKMLKVILMLLLMLQNVLMLIWYWCWWCCWCWWYFQWADENKPMKMTMIVLWTDYTFVMKYSTKPH